MPGYEMGRQLGLPAMYVERVDGKFQLRRNFTLKKNQPVLMVEDIISTGVSSRECIEAISAAGGKPVAAACLIDRSGGKAKVGVPLVALAEWKVPAWEADKLPPHLRNIPAVKPGAGLVTRRHSRVPSASQQLRDWLLEPGDARRDMTSSASASTSIMSRRCGMRAAAPYPDPVRAAMLAAGGRRRRHHRASARRPPPYLRRRYRHGCRASSNIPLNLEMAATDEMLAIALQAQAACRLHRAGEARGAHDRRRHRRRRPAQPPRSPSCAALARRGIRVSHVHRARRAPARRRASRWARRWWNCTPAPMRCRRARSASSMLQNIRDARGLSARDSGWKSMPAMA